MTDAHSEYIFLHRQLELLIYLGKDESQRGEDIRARLEKLWYQLPEDVRRGFNKDVNLPTLP